MSKQQHLQAAGPHDPAHGTGIAGDAAFSMFAKGLYLVSRLGLPPIVLASVSLADYGLWSACFIVVGYIGLADLGMASIYVRYTAKLSAASDTAGIGRLVSTGIACMLVLSAAVLGLLALGTDRLFDLLRVESSQRRLAALLLYGSVAVFLFDMTLNAFAYVLHGLQRIRDEQKVWVAAFLIEFALIVIFLWWGLGVLALLLAFALRYLFSTIANVRLVYLALPGIEVRPSRFDGSLLRELFGFGLKVQASTACAMTLHSFDRLAAGAAFGPHAVALFDLGAKLPVSASSVPSGITQVVLPAASKLGATSSTAAALKDPAVVALLSGATRSVALAAIVPLAFVGVFAVPICLAWLGVRPDLQNLPLIMALASAGAFFHILTGPGSSLFRGLGLIGYEFAYHAMRFGCLGIGIAIAWLAAGLGIESLALALSGGTCIAAIGYLCLIHIKLDAGLGGLFRDVLAPALAILAIALGLLMAWNFVIPSAASRWFVLSALIPFGCAHCGLALLVAWRALSPIERTRLRALLARFGHRFNTWRTT